MPLLICNRIYRDMGGQNVKDTRFPRCSWSVPGMGEHQRDFRKGLRCAYFHVKKEKCGGGVRSEREQGRKPGSGSSARSFLDKNKQTNDKRDVNARGCRMEMGRRSQGMLGSELMPERGECVCDIS